MAFGRVRLMLGQIGRLWSGCARHVGGCMCAGIERGWCGSRAVAALSEGTLARDVTKEYSRGTPPMGAVRGYRRGTAWLWVRRSTAERPSPLRVCSILYNNTLNGSVPSSLSALTNLKSLCVPPSCQWRLRACGRGGSDRSALLRVHGMSGDAWRGKDLRCGSRAIAVLLRY
jgi:hypothetical protein